MATTSGSQLSQLVREKAGEFRRLCAGLDEETASRAPVGRWSPKQIVSHLCGPEGIGMLPMLRAFVEQETPRLDLDPANPFFSEKRAGMTLVELLEEFDREYSRITEFVAGLSEQQLNRKAHIPILKDMPMGEYPTLAAFTQMIVDGHLAFHDDHMREILEALGAHTAR
jgi:hypothetical protein